jgi:hypothetical protein
MKRTPISVELATIPTQFHPFFERERKRSFRNKGDRLRYGKYRI